MPLASTKASASRSSGARYERLFLARLPFKHGFATQTEHRMVDICQGQKNKRQVLDESNEKYKEMFVKTRLEFQKLIAVSMCQLDV